MGVFTLTLWCLWDGTSGTQHFLTKSNSWGADTMMFQVEVKGGNSNPDRTDRFALAYQGATQAILHEVPKNGWAHMALTFDGTNARGYLNGVNEVGPQPTGIGAFRRFKDAIYEYDIADDWYKYRNEALQEIAIDWCQENGIDFDE